MKKAEYPGINGEINRATPFRQGVFLLIKTGVNSGLQSPQNIWY
jgi:hypothetical protein